MGFLAVPTRGSTADPATVAEVVKHEIHKKTTTQGAFLLGALSSQCPLPPFSGKKKFCVEI